MNFSVGDIVQMKKQHPCGSNEWEVLRVGIDFRIKCCGCGHMVMLPRTKFEKNVKKTIKQASGNGIKNFRGKSYGITGDYFSADNIFCNGTFNRICSIKG